MSEHAPSSAHTPAVAAATTAAIASATSGRIRRKRKSGRLSVASAALSSASMASAVDVWGELEAQIERTLLEGRAEEDRADEETEGERDGGVEASLKSTPLVFSAAVKALPHSHSLPLLRSTPSYLPFHLSPPRATGAAPLWASPDWSDTSSAFSPSPSFTAFSPSSTPSSSSPASSQAPLFGGGVSDCTSPYPDSRELLDPSRLLALTRRAGKQSDAPLVCPSARVSSSWT